MEKKQLKSRKNNKNIIFKLLSKYIFSASVHPLRRDEAREKNWKPEKNIGRTLSCPFPKQKRLSCDAQEPTSPKISCTGRIMDKKKTTPGKGSLLKKERTPSSTLLKMFVATRGSDAKLHGGRPRPMVRTSQQVRRLTSRHETFKNFDRRGFSDALEGPIKEEVVVDLASLVLVGEGVSLEPKKSVNLWERRNKSPPTALQLS